LPYKKLSKFTYLNILLISTKVLHSYVLYHFVQLCIFICTLMQHVCMYISRSEMMTIHCQTSPLDCSMIDSAIFQNRNAICCTYNRSYRSWQRLVIFEILNNVERRNRVNVLTKRKKKRTKKKRKEMRVLSKKEELQKWVCEWVNTLHARMAITMLIYIISNIYIYIYIYIYMCIYMYRCIKLYTRK